MPLVWDSISALPTAAPRGATTEIAVTLAWTGGDLDTLPTIKLEQNDGTVILSTSSTGDVAHSGSDFLASFNIPGGTAIDTAYKVYASSAIATVLIDGDTGSDSFEVQGRAHRDNTNTVI